MLVLAIVLIAAILLVAALVAGFGGGFGYGGQTVVRRTIIRRPARRVVLEEPTPVRRVYEEDVR